MSVTSRDVARLLGISQSTVSRALRDDPRVAEATRVRVAQAAERLGYIPNVAARSLVSQRTGTVAIVVPNVADPLQATLLEAAHDALVVAGYRVQLVAEPADGRTSSGALPGLRDRSVDGAVVTSAMLDSDAVRWLAERHIPVVLLGRHTGSPSDDRVGTDDIIGARDAADLLWNLGHRDIGLIAGPSHVSTSADRETGLREGLAARGIPLQERFVARGGLDYRSGRQHGIELLGSGERPTAIFCIGDVLAFGALDAARSLGLDVPGDVSLVGFGDLPMAQWDAFALTTVAQPHVEMARAAVRRLVVRMESADALQGATQLFPARLVVRSSTGPAPRG